MKLPSRHPGVVALIAVGMSLVALSTMTLAIGACAWGAFFAYYLLARPAARRAG